MSGAGSSAELSVEEAVALIERMAIGTASEEEQQSFGDRILRRDRTFYQQLISQQKIYDNEAKIAEEKSRRLKGICDNFRTRLSAPSGVQIPPHDLLHDSTDVSGPRNPPAQGTSPRSSKGLKDTPTANTAAEQQVSLPGRATGAGAGAGAGAGPSMAASAVLSRVLSAARVTGIRDDSPVKNPSQPARAHSVGEAASTKEVSPPSLRAQSAGAETQAGKNTTPQLREASAGGSAEARKDPPPRLGAPSAGGSAPPKKHPPTESRASSAGGATRARQAPAAASAPRPAGQRAFNALDLIRSVASNTASADQTQEFERRLLHDVGGFRNQVKEQKEKHGLEGNVIHEAHLFGAMIRVIVDKGHLPPRGPPLPIEDYLGPEESLGEETDRVTARSSAHTNLLRKILRAVTHGNPTTAELQMFRNQLHHNEAFYDLTGRVRDALAALPQQEDKDKAATLTRELQLCDAKDARVRGGAAEGIASVGGSQSARPSAGGASAGGDPAARPSASGASAGDSPTAAPSPDEASAGERPPGRLSAARTSTASARAAASIRPGHIENQVSLMELVASGNATRDHLRWYAREFKRSSEYRQEVLEQDRIFRSQRSMTGYTKAVFLRLAVGRRDRELMKLFPVDPLMDEACDVELQSLVGAPAVATAAAATAARAAALPQEPAAPPRQTPRAFAPFQSNATPPRRPAQRNAPARRNVPSPASASASGSSGSGESTPRSRAADAPLRRAEV